MVQLLPMLPAFSRDALTFALALQPTALIAVVALISLVRAGIKQRPFRRQIWEGSPLVCFFAPAVLRRGCYSAVGVLCAAPLTGPPFARFPNRAGVRYLDAVMYSSFASCVFWIWRMKGFRCGSPVALMALMEGASTWSVVRRGNVGDWRLAVVGEQCRAQRKQSPTLTGWGWKNESPLEKRACRQDWRPHIKGRCS